MKTSSFSLIRVGAPLLTQAEAARWIEATERPTLARLLGNWGLGACRIGTAEPRDDGSAGAEPGWHHCYIHAEGTQIDVVVPDRLVDRLCTLRFGGGGAEPRANGPRETRRGDALKGRIAGQIAQALIDDLPMNDWQKADDRLEDRAGLPVAIPLHHPQTGDCSLWLRLTASSAPPVAAHLEDSGWREQMAAVGRTVRLPLRAVVARPVISAGEVARLAVGDVLPIRAPDRVTLLTGQHRLAQGRLIEVDGHAGVSVAAFPGGAA